MATNCKGLSYDDSPCNCLPPNDVIAAGPTEDHGRGQHRLPASTDKDGNDPLAREDFSDFWAPPRGITTSSFISDPYVVYDPLGRPALAYVRRCHRRHGSRHLDMLFAVSGDSNATDGFWFMEGIHYTISDSDDLDFPKIGFNYVTVMLEANVFAWTSQKPEFTVFAAIDKAATPSRCRLSVCLSLPGYPQNFRADGTSPDGRAPRRRTDALLHPGEWLRERLGRQKVVALTNT